MDKRDKEKFEKQKHAQHQNPGKQGSQFGGAQPQKPANPQQLSPQKGANPQQNLKGAPSQQNNPQR